MNLIDVIQGGTISLFRAELIYIAIGILSGFGIIYLYIQEGESAWIMSTLPISKKDFALQKALSAFSLFPLYTIPAILLVSAKMRYGIPVILMHFVSGFVKRGYSGLYSIVRFIIFSYLRAGGCSSEISVFLLMVI